MMRALYKIGILPSSTAGSELAKIVDLVPSGTLVIALQFKRNKDDGVELANPKVPFASLFEASAQNMTKLGYKRRGAKGPNFTPVAISTFDETKDTADKIKTFDEKLLGFYKGYSGSNIRILAIQEFFQDEKLVIELRQQCFAFMMKLFQGKSKKDRPNTLLTVTIDGKLPGECKEYQKLLLGSSTEILGAGQGEGMGTCSLTFESNTQVYGNPSKIFPFYTIDKPGMITGGFQEEQAWKNFPVSAGGGLGLKLARDHLDQKQKFYMPGSFRYWVIPKFVFGENPELLEEMLENLARYSEKSPGFGLGRLAGSGFTEMEENLKFLRAEAFDQVLLTFLFYEAPQKGQLKIRLAVDDVPPTRLKQLITAQKDVAQLQTYYQWIQQTFPQPEKEGSSFGGPIHFSFGLAWSFYNRKAQKAGESQYDSSYLQFIRELYLGHPLEPGQILPPILETLEAHFKNPEIGEIVFNYVALQSLCWIRYLCELNMWKPVNQNKGAAMKLEELSIEPAYKARRADGRLDDPWMAHLEAFYKEHQTMLARPFLFGTFLLGCLIRLLMNVQAANLRSTPFEKEIKGLRLKKLDIAPLFSKTIAKLRDYGQGDTYRVFDELISDLCLRNRENSDLVSNDEVSAYLAFGLAQGRVFKKLVDAEKKENNEFNQSL